MTNYYFNRKMLQDFKTFFLQDARKKLGYVLVKISDIILTLGILIFSRDLFHYFLSAVFLNFCGWTHLLCTIKLTRKSFFAVSVTSSLIILFLCWSTTLPAKSLTRVVFPLSYNKYIRQQVRMWFDQVFNTIGTGFHHVLCSSEKRYFLNSSLCNISLIGMQTVTICNCTIQSCKHTFWNWESFYLNYLKTAFGQPISIWGAHIVYKDQTTLSRSLIMNHDMLTVECWKYKSGYAP